MAEHIRIVTTQGPWFDLDKPKNFEMVGFVMAIKAAGHLLNQRVYQPLEGIATIFIWDDAQPPKDGGVNLPDPTNEVSQTKQ